MGLFDAFRRPQIEVDPEVYRRVGKLEAEVEKLSLSWLAYRDELKRLVQRLEKRDQRARERAERDEEEVQRVMVAPEPDVDPITAQVLARRNHGVRRISEG